MDRVGAALGRVGAVHRVQLVHDRVALTLGLEPDHPEVRPEHEQPQQLGRTERQLGVAAGDLVVGAQRVAGVERRQRRLQVLGMVELAAQAIVAQAGHAEAEVRRLVGGDRGARRPTPGRHDRRARLHPAAAGRRDRLARRDGDRRLSRTSRAVRAAGRAAAAGRSGRRRSRERMSSAALLRTGDDVSCTIRESTVGVLTGPEVERDARREVDVARQDHAARVGGEPAHDGVERLLVAAPALDVEALGPADGRAVVIGLGLALGVRHEVDDPRRQRLDQRLDGVGHQDRHRRRRRPAARARR